MGWLPRPLATIPTIPYYDVALENFHWQDGRLGLGEVRSKMCNISSVVFDCRDDNYTWITPRSLLNSENPGIFQLVTSNPNCRETVAAGLK